MVDDIGNLKERFIEGEVVASDIRDIAIYPYRYTQTSCLDLFFSTGVNLLLSAIDVMTAPKRSISDQSSVWWLAS